MSIALILSKTPVVAKLKFVPVYPKQIAEVIQNPRFVGTLENANATGSEAKLDCGCFVRTEIFISEPTDLIEEVSYRTNGCGFMVAAAESALARLRGMRLTDLHGEINRGAEANERSECATAVLESIRAAFSDYRVRRVEEFRGEKPLICTCFGIAEETVEQFVRASNPRDVSEVAKFLGAGSGCGSCRMLIQEIIDAND
ncbi:MAG: iron-sulfur cluster assembly scaffold protein [bacterium]|nr:iron-sulfur cluster assembly scaffold protein [bacterium]